MSKIFKNKYYRFTFFIVILIIIYSSPSECMVKYSFRLRGLGTNLFGFVDDLYSDLFFNPAYISRFNDRYIYTNLSNLQGNGEATIFDQDNVNNNDFPSNLIGTIGKFGKHSFGGFWESSKHSFENIDEKSYEDFPPNPALKIYSSEMLKRDFTGQSFTMFGMFRDIGYIVSIDRLGMNLDWSIKNDTSLTSNPSAITKSSDEEKGELKFPNSLLSFAIGKVYKNDKRELSISGGMMPERLGINMTNIFPVLNEPIINRNKITYKAFEDIDLGYVQLGIKSYFLNSRYKTIHTDFDKFHQNNYLFNFTHYRLPLNIKTNRGIIADTTITGSGGNILNYRKKMIDNEVSGSGSAGINNLIFGFGTERHFDGLKNMAVIGVKLQYTWGKFELDEGPGTETESFHRFMGSADSTVYKNVFGDNRIIKTRGKANELMISIPIGLEMNLTKNFTFRLGANASIPLSFDGSWKRTITDSTNTLISSSGSGPTIPSEEKPMFTDEKISNLKGKLINLTTYYFGASYKISNSINIDFLNFADITNLKTWWLSVVFKY